MLTVGQKLPEFKVTGVKPGFNAHEENGVSAFEKITDASFPGQWKVIFFYPKDFTFVCPTEIAEFARLGRDFADRDAVVLGGSVDNEHVKLAWRRSHPDLDKLPIWSFADPGGKFARQLGVLDEENVAHRLDSGFRYGLSDPAAFAVGVEVGEEAGGDFGDESFEVGVVAVLLGVDGGLTMDDPADIAGPMRAKRDGFGVHVGMVADSAKKRKGCGR